MRYGPGKRQEDAMRVAGLVLAVALGTAAQAEDVPTETMELGKSVVTLHVHPFLTEEELATLRVIGTNKDALALFVPEGGGHAAIAMAPEEGFVRDGVPVGSAVAVAKLPDTETARGEALKGCEAAKTTKKACVVVLDVATP
jgi:hypothetical protein